MFNDTTKMFYEKTTYAFLLVRPPIPQAKISCPPVAMPIQGVIARSMAKWCTGRPSYDGIGQETR